MTLHKRPHFDFDVSFYCVVQECETLLNIAGCQEEIGQPMETIDQSFSAALSCAERSGLNKLQVC